MPLLKTHFSVDSGYIINYIYHTELPITFYFLQQSIHGKVVPLPWYMVFAKIHGIFFFLVGSKFSFLPILSCSMNFSAFMDFCKIDLTLELLILLKNALLTIHFPQASFRVMKNVSYVYTRGIFHTMGFRTTQKLKNFFKRKQFEDNKKVTLDFSKKQGPKKRPTSPSSN